MATAPPGLAARSQALNQRYNLPAKAAAPKAAKPLTLAQQAQQPANQSVAAQVAAIRQQQQLALQQASDRADQINSASRAAAQFMAGLGTPVYDSYKDAASTLADFAKGYGGNLQDTASQEANKVAADLAAAGSPQQAVNTAPQLANVLYGIRGAGPGSSLLQAGTAAAAREAAIPQQLLGYGSDLATGQLSAGRNQADQYTPQILDAQGKLPSIAQQYLQQFQQQQNNARDYNLKVAALNSLDTSRTNTTKLTEQRLTQQQNQFITNQRRLAQQFNANQATAADKLALPNTALSKVRGYLVDGTGNPILDQSGSRQILPGFKQNPAGKIVKVAAPKNGAAGTGSNPNFPNLTKAQVLHLRAGIATAFYGRPAQTDPNDKKKILRPALPAVDYWTAVQEAVKAGYSKAGAIKMANRFYQPGKRGRPKGP